MKINILIIAAAVSFAACKNNDTKSNANALHAATDTANYTTIQWLDSNKNVGTINFGEKPEIKFRFKNTGDKPLFIINAQPGCGCTVADYPKGAIAPGDEGEITAGYDSNKGSEGEFRKNIAITTNTKGSTNTELYFYGDIKKTGTGHNVESAPVPVPVDSSVLHQPKNKPFRKLKLNHNI